MANMTQLTLSARGISGAVNWTHWEKDIQTLSNKLLNAIDRGEEFNKILLQYLRKSSSRLFAILSASKKMVIHHNVKGYDEFSKLLEELEQSGQTIHVLFSGGKNENGESWCPYCVKAEPVVSEALRKAAEKSHFVHVDVGERTFWKDLNCPFRKDPNTHLVFLPTLLRWKAPQRLDGERVSNKDLVEMMFEDED